MGSCYPAPSAAKRVVANTIIRKATIEITKPAIAKPLGFRNRPIKESSPPKKRTNQPKIGIQLVNKAISDNTKPATPSPLVFFSGTVTYTFCGSFCCVIAVLFKCYLNIAIT